MFNHLSKRGILAPVILLLLVLIIFLLSKYDPGWLWLPILLTLILIPITLSRRTKAPPNVDEGSLSPTNPTRPTNQLVLHGRKAMKVIQYEEISYLEAGGNYVTIYLNNGGQHISSKSLYQLEARLSPSIFFRVHKSYLINCDQVVGYEGGRGGQVFLKGGVELPIAFRRKSAFTQFLSAKGMVPDTVSE